MTLRRVALIVFLLDQGSKALVAHGMRVGQSWPLVGNFLELTYVQNPGSAFGLLASAPAVWRIPFFILVTLGACLLIYAYQRFLPPEARMVRWVLGLISGGILGNFVDRLWLGKVIDFIDVGLRQYRWPVFNLADSAITIGLSLLIFDFLRKRQTEN